MNSGDKFGGERDGDPVSSVLRALPQVSAPDGFEHSVANAIRARSDERSMARAPWLKVAVPAAALAALVLFFSVSSYISREIPTIAVVSDNSNPTDQPVAYGAATSDANFANDANIERAAAQPNESVNGQSLAARDQRDQKEERSSKARPINSSSQPRGGSTDIGADAPSRPILPRGLSLEPLPDARAPGIGVDSSVRLVDILRFSGIIADFDKNEFVVAKVVENSPAKRAGIQAGDIIESVNEIKLTPDAAIRGGIGVRSFGILRSGERLTVRF